MDIGTKVHLHADKRCDQDGVIVDFVKHGSGDAVRRIAVVKVETGTRYVDVSSIDERAPHISAITKGETLTDWMPISSAPRDGSQILAKDANGYTICAWHNDTRGPGASGYIQHPGWEVFSMGNKVYDEGWDTGNGYTLEASPTHWLPKII